MHFDQIVLYYYHILFYHRFVMVMLSQDLFFFIIHIVLICQINIMTIVRWCMFAYYRPFNIYNQYRL